MIPDPLVTAAEDPRIAGDALRVLIELHRLTDYFSHKPIKLAVIAFRLKKKKPQVSLAMRTLTAHGYVDRGPFDATVGFHAYRLTVPPDPLVNAHMTRKAA
jgi:hypothetical protein